MMFGFAALGLWSYTWQWRGPQCADSPTRGVLAQDVAGKYPFAAHQGADGSWRVNYRMLAEMAAEQLKHGFR